MNKPFNYDKKKISNNRLVLPFFLSFTTFSISCCYYLFFSEAINSGEWLDVKGFTKIIIPDSFLYLDVLNAEETLQSLIESNVKNTIGPSIIWFLVQKNWIMASLFNSILLLFTFLYLLKIADILEIEEKKLNIVMLTLALLPSTIYHSVGVLKEIPCMLFLVGFFYHYLKNDRVLCLLYTAAATIFRGQLALVLGIFWISNLLRNIFKYNHLLFVWYIFLAISALYPFLQIGAFESDSTAVYREQANGGGLIGSFVESVRNSIPIVSIIAILFRICQTVFDPLLILILQGSLLENGFVSLIHVMYLSSLVVCLPAWFSFYNRIKKMILNRNHYSVDKNTISLYAFCLSFIYPVGGFSFIHYRYLYPITALLLVAGSIKKQCKIR
jgi:hypothetical protein